jgi:hypothetical protein
MTRAIESVTGVARGPVTVAMPRPQPTGTYLGRSVDQATAAEVQPPRIPAHAPASRVEVSLTAGVQTVIIVDVASGRAIYQAPPEHTRQLFDKAVSRSKAVARRAVSG